MDKLKAARPQRSKRTKKVQPPLSANDKELFEEKEEVTKMKYAPRMKVGTPSIKAPGTKVVKTVGLGNLQVETVNGNTNIRSK